MFFAQIYEFSVLEKYNKKTMCPWKQALMDKEHYPYYIGKKSQICVNAVVFSYKKVKHSQEQNTLPSSCPFNLPLILTRRKCL